MLRRRRPVCERVGDDRFVLRLGDAERSVIDRMLGDLDDLVALAEDPTSATVPQLTRLFPPAFTDHEGDDAERDTEYQRLMRTELVASKRAGIAAVREAFSSADDDEVGFDTAGLTAFMQSMNSLRLVLGSLLGVTDDEAASMVDDQIRESPEHELFAWSGWILEWVVQALSTPAN
ncbi:MAG: DUF2017 family protein [Actinomycetota bacterium]|jgi:hypothetical protein|nr:DUF2017 family protein [Actinomycetota bacterium]